MRSPRENSKDMSCAPDRMLHVLSVCTLSEVCENALFTRSKTVQSCVKVE